MDVATVVSIGISLKRIADALEKGAQLQRQIYDQGPAR